MARKNFWSEQEDKLLEQMWPTHTLAEISAALLAFPRSAKIVSWRGRRLGLPSRARPPVNFTPEQIDEILELRKTMRYIDIAERFGVSIHPIQKLLCDLGATGEKGRGVAKGCYTTKPKTPKRPLGRLEISEGNFAVDDFSYRAITGREPEGTAT